MKCKTLHALLLSVLFICFLFLVHLRLLYGNALPLSVLKLFCKQKRRYHIDSAVWLVDIILSVIIIADMKGPVKKLNG